ncbi:Ger(x)C family spore germination protein [Pseudalkalibacillus caeni]|nr:Ger(x)C family spore germination protein [Pseudalkalibacillus caeni]
MKAVYTIFIFTVMVFTLAGCSGRIELNDLLLITSVGIDKGEGDRVKLTFQATNPQAQAGGQGSSGAGGSTNPDYTFESEGYSVNEAVNNARNFISRKLFFSQMSMLVVGEEMAKEKGVKEILDFLERHYEIRDNYFFLIAKDSSAKEILSTLTPIENNSSKTIEKLINISEGSVGIKDGITLENFIRWLYGEKRSPVALGIKKKEKNSNVSNFDTLNDIDGNPNSIQLTGLALFNEDKQVDWFTKKESSAWGVLTGRSADIQNFTFHCPDGDGRIGILLKDIKGKAVPTLKGNQLTYRIKMSGQMNLQEMSCRLKLTEEQGANAIQTAVSKGLEKQLVETVRKAQKLKLDFFGIQSQLFKNHPKSWEKQKDNWEALYQEMKVKADVQVYIESPGARLENNYESK